MTSTSTLAAASLMCNMFARSRHRRQTADSTVETPWTDSSPDWDTLPSIWRLRSRFHCARDDLYAMHLICVPAAMLLPQHHHQHMEK